jgi:hypothetical protein
MAGRGGLSSKHLRLYSRRLSSLVSLNKLITICHMIHQQLMERMNELVNEDVHSMRNYVQRHNAGFFKDNGFEFLDNLYLPLAPFLLEQDYFDGIRSDMLRLLDILISIESRIFPGDRRRYLDFLRISEVNRDLINYDASISSVARVARPDCVLSSRSARVLEFNVGSGIGLVPICHPFMKFHRGNPTLRKAAEKLGMEIKFLDPLPFHLKLINSLPSPVYFAPVRREKNRIISGFANAWHRHIQAAVSNVIIDDPSALDIKCDEVYFGDELVRSMYIGMSAYKLREKQPALAGFIRAFENSPGRVCVTSPTSLILENKRNMVLLSDPKFSHFFSAGERVVLDRCIPWTRSVTQDIAEQVSRNHTNYVLKACEGEEGEKVVIGKDVSRQDFVKRLREAVAEENWIVQEFETGLQFENLFLNGDSVLRLKVPFIARMFIMDGELSGFHCGTSVFDPRTGSFGQSAGRGETGGGVTAIVSS